MSTEPSPSPRFAAPTPELERNWAIDADLIERCLAGDQPAWNELIDRYGDLVFSIARRRYRFGVEASEDVFQDVFAALHKRLPKIENRRALPKWLIVTTHRVCQRHLDKQTRHEAADTTATAIDETTPGEIEAWEERQRCHRALEQLGDRCRELLTRLYADDGVSYDEIALTLNMPRGSIGPTRARCLQQLARLLALVEDEEDRADG